MNKIKINKMNLKSVSGKLLNKIPDKSKPLNIDLKHICKINYNGKNNSAIMHMDSIINPNPKALFEIKISHEIHFNYDEEISSKNLFLQSPELSQNIGIQISHLVSIISKELIGTHIILPPNMNFESIF